MVSTKLKIYSVIVALVCLGFVVPTTDFVQDSKLSLLFTNLNNTTSDDYCSKYAPEVNEFLNTEWKKTSDTYGSLFR